MKVSKEQTIRTEQKKLQGQTQFQSFEVSVPATVGTYVKDVSFPFDVNLIRGRWFNKAEFNGDSLEMTVADDTIIGAITANVAVDDTVISVSQMVIDNTYCGFYLKCEGQEWGRVVGMDTELLTVTIETPATAAITATGAQYVLQTVKYVPHLYLEGSDTMMVLEGGVGSSYLPANTVVKIKYHNDTGTEKTYSAIFEYFY